MDFLLDTHTFIWFINGDKLLPDNVIAKIKNIENQCFFSVASIWEIAIKMKLNKIYRQICCTVFAGAGYLPILTGS